jgi:hypothetical protein
VITHCMAKSEDVWSMHEEKIATVVARTVWSAFLAGLL